MSNNPAGTELKKRLHHARIAQNLATPPIEQTKDRMIEIFAKLGFQLLKDPKSKMTGTTSRR